MNEKIKTMTLAEAMEYIEIQSDTIEIMKKHILDLDNLIDRIMLFNDRLIRNLKIMAIVLHSVGLIVIVACGIYNYITGYSFGLMLDLVLFVIGIYCLIKVVLLGRGKKHDRPNGNIETK